MSLGKLDHAQAARRREVVVTGSAVLMHCILPSVGRFKLGRRQHHVGNIRTRVTTCASLKAAYAQSLAPVCGHGVFNTGKVVEKLAK